MTTSSNNERQITCWRKRSCVAKFSIWFRACKRQSELYTGLYLAKHVNFRLFIHSWALMAIWFVDNFGWRWNVVGSHQSSRTSQREMDALACIHQKIRTMPRKRGVWGQEPAPLFIASSVNDISALHCWRVNVIEWLRGWSLGGASSSCNVQELMFTVAVDCNDDCLSNDERRQADDIVLQYRLPSFSLTRARDRRLNRATDYAYFVDLECIEHSNVWDFATFS